MLIKKKKKKERETQRKRSLAAEGRVSEHSRGSWPLQVHSGKMSASNLLAELLGEMQIWLKQAGCRIGCV